MDFSGFDMQLFKMIHSLDNYHWLNIKLYYFPHSWLIIGYVTRLARRVPLVEQERLPVPEHMTSPPVFSGIRVTRSLVLCVCFVDCCLSFSTFSFGDCVVCSSSIYGYLQTLHTTVLYRCFWSHNSEMSLKIEHKKRLNR